MASRSVQMLVVALAGLLAPVARAQQSWALDAVKIYSRPDVPALSGQVVIAGAKIQSVAPASDKRATGATRAPQCNGGVIVAGFQNSHVHFTGDEFRDALITLLAAGCAADNEQDDALTLMRAGDARWVKISSPDEQAQTNSDPYAWLIYSPGEQSGAA